MPSAFSHAAVALAAAPAFWAPGTPRRLWVLGAACAAAPDLDVIGLGLGVPYGDLLGHRGISHSIAFAVLLAAAVALAALPRRWWARGFVYLAVVSASHGLLDACTNGGLGIALLAPFDDRRIFFPFRPIEVSPIGLHAFPGPRGLAVLRSELAWIGPPALALAAAGAWMASRRRRRYGNPT